MEQINNSRKQLFFDEAFLKVSSDILQKYKLDETPEEFVEKIKTNRQLFCDIFMDVVRDFFGGLIKETELSSLFKKKFDIPEETASNLAVDTKEKIFPLIKEIAAPAGEEMVDGNVPSYSVKKAPIISVEENKKGFKKERESIVTKKLVDTEEIKTPIKKTKKPPLSEKNKEPAQQPRGRDNYREIIE